MKAKLTIHYIYCITNMETCKVYIGKTNNLKKRWQEHRNPNQWYKTSKLYNAFVKYGLDKFKFEVLAYTTCSNEINILECYYIALSDSICKGYNITKGGQGGPIRYGKDNGMYGRTHTDRVKEIISNKAIKQFKDKSYETLYGSVKADILKKSRSDKMKDYIKLNPINGCSNPRAKSFEFTKPNGEVDIVSGGIKDYCKKNGLCLSMIYKILDLNIPYKGWIVKRIHRSPILG